MQKSVFRLLVITFEPFELEASCLICSYLVGLSSRSSGQESLVFPFPVSSIRRGMLVPTVIICLLSQKPGVSYIVTRIITPGMPD